ncbi:MAG: AraC family transcriptional regulator [Bacteroidota bacterium]
MVKTVIYIQNMRCDCCIQMVKIVLKAMGILFLEVELGKAILCDELSPKQEKKLTECLSEIKHPLLKNKENLSVEKIEHYIQQWIELEVIGERPKLSYYLADKLCYCYKSIENYFVQKTGKSIRVYKIKYRAKCAEHQLRTSDIDIAEIAQNLHYSGKEHLCKQFKQVMGKSPEQFRKDLLPEK